jgi:hypothetical protein
MRTLLNIVQYWFLCDVLLQPLLGYCNLTIRMHNVKVRIVAVYFWLGLTLLHQIN